MEPVTALAFFVLGFISGGCGVIALTVYIGTRSLKKKAAAVGEVAAPKKPSINARMKRVKEITQEQLDLSDRASGPQKNALDGKYKNGLIGQLKQLDDEKNEILISILKDGVDPELTTMDGAGVVTKMLLSEYMAYMGIGVPQKTDPKQGPTKVERMGKFTVHKGGKDDGGGNTTH